MVPEPLEPAGGADRRQTEGALPVEEGTAYLRPPTDTPTRAAARYVPPGSDAELITTHGPHPGAHYRLPTGKATTLGRAGDCDIVLDDPTVSRHHAEIVYDQGRFVLSDTGSWNGTSLNGSPVITAALADGDELALGRQRIAVAIAADLPRNTFGTPLDESRPG